ncbi:MAG: hypothetical protein ACT4PV_02855 [Planctomycetaceae bacterium]
MRTAILTLFFASLLPAGEQPREPVLVPGIVDLRNALCPVTGAKIETGVTEDRLGVRVHLAGEEARVRFREKPGAFLAKLGLEIAGTAEAPIVDLANARCPVMGRPAKAEVFATLGSVRVRFCCARCKTGFPKEAGKHLATLGYTYLPPVMDLRNKECPVMAQETVEGEGEIFADFDGIRVRFCCDECIETFRKDPARYYRKMGIDPAALRERLE